MLSRLRTALAPRRPRRALLCWEWGAGRTHISNILGVTRHLRAAGIECLAALYDNRADREFAALGVSTVQTYVWPGWRRWSPHEHQRPSRTLMDIVANHGMAEPATLAAAIAHYDGLFALWRPDIVLCENAHGAILAARDRVPVVAFGYGQLLPPTDGDDFPPFSSDDPEPSWPVADVLDGVNQGLLRGGRPPLSRATDLLRIDAVMPFGPAAFDSFGSSPGRRPLPVHAEGFSPGMRAGEGRETFVYLQGFATRRPAVLAALVSLRRPMRAYIQDIDLADADAMAAAGVILETRPVPIADILERSRCVLSHGGVSLTAACLSAGLPHVIIGKEFDNRLSGAFVEAQGLGEHRWLWDATTAWLVAATRRAYDDEALRARCRESAPDFDAWFGGDPTAAVAAEACRLIGIRPSGVRA